MQNEKGITDTEHKTLTIDVDKYQALLDDTNIPENKKQEFLESVIYIVLQFVDWGWGINPTQQARCGNTLPEKSDTNSAIPHLIREFADHSEKLSKNNNETHCTELAESKAL